MQVIDKFATVFRRCVRLIVLASVLAVYLGSVARPQAQDRSAQGPFLRIDAGMHSAAITAIATDAQNKYVVTAS